MSTLRRRPILALLLALGVLLTTGSVPAAAAVDGAVGTAADEVPVGVWPLDPVPDVVERFDPPDTPYGRGHRGVDLAGRVGQEVRSALPGSVTYAGPLAGRGVVVVDHGPTRTTYQPVAAAVAVGDEVVAGQVIGRLLADGSHCAPAACLHWGWIEGETYLDPLLLVGAGPVLLLPLVGGGTAPWSWQPPGAWWSSVSAAVGLGAWGVPLDSRPSRAADRRASRKAEEEVGPGLADD